MSSSKNNVNPDFYKTAGREPPGQDVNQEVQKQKYTEAQAKFSQTQKNESGSEFIPGNTSYLPNSSNPAATEKDNEQDKSSDKF
ncbi:MAG: hypothetical protein M3033_03445 [Acidobacteriota bacterium]|nr:hypothetical protein [Acidobacteriota bacterium]